MIQEVHRFNLSCANLPTSYDFRPELPARDYHEKAIQNKIPPKVRCIPISEPAVSSNQTTQSQKLDLIIGSCQVTRTLQSSSDDIQIHMYTILIPLLDIRHSQRRHDIQNAKKR